MAQQPTFENLSPMKLVGISMEMSRTNDQTPRLWGRFMPQRNAVLNRVDANLISMQVYPDGPVQISDPALSFTKWAVAAVTSFDSIPDGMQAYQLDGGLYAVFRHNGPATDMSTVMFIFGEWLPNSDYLLDDREHFEVLPSDYQPLAPDAYEDFWIPVRPKSL